VGEVEEWQALKINKLAAHELRAGILDARKGTPRAWDTDWPKQGPYWEAYTETLSAIRLKALFADCQKQWNE